jgi:N-acetyl-gamma-glutamyl-phosphate reductase
MNVRCAIVGPTGYTGLHLIKLLARHPEAQVTYLASHRDQLPHIVEEFPELLGVCDLACRPIDPQVIAAEADVAFVCLPHVSAMQYVPQLLDAGLRVIDLSADYRLPDPQEYARAYQHEHTDPANLSHAVYGLPEINDQAIAGAKLVANPGCYPTAAILAIGPLLVRNLVEPTGIIINTASGASGAGRALRANLQFVQVNEGFVPYGVGTHRHQPEIRHVLAALRGGPVDLLFVPHLLPVNVGILESIYMDPAGAKVDEDALFGEFEEAYADEPFVRVRMGLPNVRDVAGTNFCDLTVRLTGGKVVVFAAVDNLIKGASGQAIQNMNLMFGLDEAAGLL